MLALGAMAGIAQAQPTITQQPTNVLVTPGGTATFSVTVSGTGPFTYQWQYGGTNISPGIITTVAGDGTPGYSGDGSAATSAEIQNPNGVLVDSRGRVFIADYQNFRVRMVDTNGIISTVAGNGTSGNPSNGSVASNAPLGSVIGLAMDNAGNLYLSDASFKAIRKVDTNDIITTITSGGFGLNAGLCVDASGNIFVADEGRSFPPMPSRIFEVATNGSITTVAGGGGSYPGNGGAAVSAQLRTAEDVAVDSTGQLFIAEQGVVCRVDTNGIIWTVASANLATGVKEDALGNIFFADDNNNRIYEVSAVNGTNAVVVGNGTFGYSGDNGPATSAELNSPWGIALDSTGNLFISDNGNSAIRKVAGIPPYPVNQPVFLVANASTNNNGNYSVVVTGSGGSVTSSVATLTLWDPPVITTEPASQIAFSGQAVSLNVVAHGGMPLIYQWFDNGAILSGQTNSTLSFPSVVTNNSGSYTVTISNSYTCVTSAPPALLAVAPSAGNEVSLTNRTVTLNLGSFLGSGWDFQWQLDGTNLPGGTIVTFAGKGIQGYGGDGGAATNAKLNSPAGVAVDSAGNVYIVDSANSLVRKVDASGTITTVAGLVTGGTPSGGYSGDNGPATSAQLFNPVGIAVDAAGDLFIADSGNYVIRKVNTNGTITTVAGDGSLGYTPDGGPATSAALANPTGIAVDAAGDLFIAESWNSLVRKVDTNGILTTAAGWVSNGVPTYGYTGDGGAGTNAQLDGPAGLAVDAAGNLYISDADNHAIRKVGTNGIITTVAGVGYAGYTGDGGAATNATLDSPYAVTIGALGDMFISDYGNEVVRKVDAIGNITTVAGNGVGGYSGDGGLATNAKLNAIYGVAVDANEDIFIGDDGNNRVRKVTNQSGPLLVLNGVTANNAGNYTVVATGSSGSVTSSILSLSVISAPLINQKTMNADGSFTLGLESQSGSASVVYSATNLSAVWQPISTNSVGGIWQFRDTNTVGNPSKYYRLFTQ